MDFRDKLASLGWSQAKLARKLGVFPSTVTEWANRGEAPRYADAYLDLAIEAKAASERLREMVQ